jgi:hypothetical protein
MSFIQSCSVLQSGTITVTALFRSRRLAQETSMSLDKTPLVLHPAANTVTTLSCLRRLGQTNFCECRAEYFRSQTRMPPL